MWPVPKVLFLWRSGDQQQNFSSGLSFTQSLFHWTTWSMSHPCTHQRPAKASGGRCRIVEFLIVLLSHFCCSFCPLPTAFQDQEPAWIPQVRKLQLSVRALTTAIPTKQLSRNIHSFKKWIPSNVFPALGHSRVLPNGSVCACAYTCACRLQLF